jgi:hypothetical protein
VVEPTAGPIFLSIGCYPPQDLVGSRSRPQTDGQRATLAPSLHPVAPTWSRPVPGPTVWYGIRSESSAAGHHARDDGADGKSACTGWKTWTSNRSDRCGMEAVCMRWSFWRVLRRRQLRRRREADWTRNRFVCDVTGWARVRSRCSCHVMSSHLISSRGR